MADKFSALWWNELAQSTRVDRREIERQTGLQFRNVLADPTDPTRGFLSNWQQDVKARAPGFSTSGLLITGTPEPYPDFSDMAAQLTWPESLYYVSPVGFVAPGTSTPYAPTLSEVYVAPSGAGAPDPWENTVPSQPESNTAVLIPTDPTIAVLEDDAGPAPAPSAPPGVSSPTGGKATDTGGIKIPGGAPLTTEVTEDSGADLTPTAVSSAGMFSTVSGKVLAVVALLVLGLYLASRRSAT